MSGLLREDYQLAIADYDQALLLDPQLGWAFINRGICHNALEHYDLAIQDYTQAIALGQQSALAFAESDEKDAEVCGWGAVDLI